MKPLVAIQSKTYVSVARGFNRPRGVVQGLLVCGHPFRVTYSQCPRWKLRCRLCRDRKRAAAKKAG